MRPLVIVLPILLVIAGAAPAEERPFDGRWGLDAETCLLAPGASDLVPAVIANDEIDYYASHCRIEAVEPIGGENTSAWRVRMTCSGDGETRTSESIFAIDHRAGDRRRQLIEIELEDGFVDVRQACD